MAKDRTSNGPAPTGTYSNPSGYPAKDSTPGTGTTGKSSYGQILKSSALIGGSSLLNVAIGVVRTKAMAVLLGPGGVGLLGLYGAVFDLAQSVAGMGVNSSGVRQIAEAAGTGDTGRIAQTAAVLRRTTLFLGLLGAVALAACSGPVSTLTFGNDQHAPALALLAVAVFFRVVSDSQGALIQGMRRIADLAKMNILGALSSTAITLPIVYYLGELGVVPSIVGSAALGLLISWWYSRKPHIPIQPLGTFQLGREQAALLKLGFAFMSSGLMMMGAAYLIRILLIREVGFEAAGLYQSAWGLGGMYVGFVLQSMGADFYPRLTAMARDNAACNRLVNEQAEISLLLAGPGVIATLALAPVVISLFYTAEFAAAVEVLRWLCLGMTLRIISWPMGFIILAKGAQGVFFWSELAWTLVYLGLAWFCVKYYGLNGAGLAFFGAYAFHCLLNYITARWLSGFVWSDANLKTNLVYLPLIAIVFCGFYIFPHPVAIGVGMIAALLGGIYSLRTLFELAPPNRLPGPVRRLLEGCRLAASHPREDMNPALATAPEGGMNMAIKPFLIRTLTFAFMVSTVFCMWIYWYEGIYGWQSIGADLPALENISMEEFSRIGKDNSATR